MRITVRLFARLRDITGTSKIQQEYPDGATVRVIWDALATDYTELGPYRETVSTAINAEYAQMNQTLNDGDEVAFLPPVSGG